MKLPASGRTDVAPAVARLLTALCLTGLVAVPLVQHLGPVDAGPFPLFVSDLTTLTGPADEANLRLQTAMHELEATLEDDSWLMERTLPAMQWLLTGWGGAGNEETYVGREGWLFLRPGFDYLTGPPFLTAAVLERRRQASESWRQPVEPDPRPAILDFHRQLRERGIPLLVMPVPTKATIHPDALSPSYSERKAAAAPLQNASLMQLRAELEADGIRVFDPAGTLQRLRQESPAFLRTDSHWSPEGVDAVARELAGRVRLLDLGLEQDEIAWQRRTRSHEGVGDLVKTLRLPRWGELYAPETVRLERVADGRGRPWSNDPGAEILLLGDSFSNVYSEPRLGWGRSAGLAEQLSYHLSRGVERIAVNDDGDTGGRRRLAQEGVERLAGKKLVIWQFAVRELVTGDWQLVSLPGVAE